MTATPNGWRIPLCRFPQSMWCDFSKFAPKTVLSDWSSHVSAANS